MEANQEIRRAIRQAGVRHWQVAEALDVGEGKLSRRLRKELTEEDKAKVMKAIETAKRNYVKKESHF